MFVLLSVIILILPFMFKPVEEFASGYMIHLCLLLIDEKLTFD